MLSIDSNVLLHALNKDSPRHVAAHTWLEAISRSEEVALSEFILAELYVLLRNPAVVKRPLSADKAGDIIQTFRNHPYWRIIGFTEDSRSLHDTLWRKASEPGFTFRRIYDARSALTMITHGVDEFATVNVKDFEGAGFQRVWDPLAEISN